MGPSFGTIRVQHAAAGLDGISAHREVGQTIPLATAFFAKESK